MMRAKKPISPEVANLTAKNYRLAKELVHDFFLCFEAFLFFWYGFEYKPKLDLKL